MNERIRQLADQSGYYIDPDFDIEFEQFAELIIRECADLVDRAISNGGVDGREVKEHFGVQ